MLKKSLFVMLMALVALWVMPQARADDVCVVRDFGTGYTTGGATNGWYIMNDERTFHPSKSPPKNVAPFRAYLNPWMAQTKNEYVAWDIQVDAADTYLLKVYADIWNRGVGSTAIVEASIDGRPATTFGPVLPAIGYEKLGEGPWWGLGGVYSLAAGPHSVKATILNVGGSDGEIFAIHLSKLDAGGPGQIESSDSRCTMAQEIAVHLNTNLTHADPWLYMAGKMTSPYTDFDFATLAGKYRVEARIGIANRGATTATAGVYLDGGATPIATLPGPLNAAWFDVGIHDLTKGIHTVRVALDSGEDMVVYSIRVTEVTENPGSMGTEEGVTHGKGKK